MAKAHQHRSRTIDLPHYYSYFKKKKKKLIMRKEFMFRVKVSLVDFNFDWD